MGGGGLCECPSFAPQPRWGLWIMPKMYPSPFQLQQYQTDMQSCRFDTLRKLTPAHRAEAPKCSRAVGGPAAVAIGLSDSPTV